MKNLIWVHGVKGGVGKSIMASVVVDKMLNDGFCPTVIESDGAVPDVGRRYVKSNVQSIHAPIDSIDSIYDALEVLEDGTQQNVIVNLPANAGKLDTIANEIKGTTDVLGYKNHCLFMVGEGGDSAKLAGESLKSGLASISCNPVAVVNMRFGNIIDKFEWFHSDARAKWLGAGYAETGLPVLNRRIIESPAFKRGALFPKVDGLQDDGTPAEQPLKVINRQVFKTWLTSAYAIVDMLDLDV